MESRSGTKWRQTATKLSWQRPEHGKTTTDESELKLSESRPRPGGGAICDHSGDTQAPGDNAMLGSRYGFSLTLSGLSFSHRIVIDVRLNGSER